MGGNSLSADVLIVGGGPAGLATAIALRMRGVAVTLADSMKPPIDKACGEGLMPDSLADLARLGVELGDSDGAPFCGIRFVNHGHSRAGLTAVATARFPALGGQAIGMKRRLLHGRMVERAEELGAVLRWASPVQLLESGQVLVAGDAVRYGTLVGADGQGSRVRRWAGLESGSEISRRYGFRRHYQVSPWSEFVEVHWGQSGQVYVTPTGRSEVCLAGVVRDSHCRLETLLAEMPELRDRLGDAAGPDLERGCVTTTRRLRRVTAGRVALVGDASGSADAITGEGMGVSFRQASLLAECMEGGDLRRYAQLHSGTLALAQRMARVMLWMDRSEGFRGRAIAMLAQKPEIFERMLGVHLGAESIAGFIATKGLEVAWRLVTGSSPSVSEAGLADAQDPRHAAHGDWVS